MTDGHIYAVKLLSFVITLVRSFLVKDGVNDHCCLARLAIADDQLTLPAADGDQGINGLKTSLHGLVH